MAGISESNSEVSEVFNDLSIMASWDLVWKVTRNSLSPKASRRKECDWLRKRHPSQVLSSL